MGKTKFEYEGVGMSSIENMDFSKWLERQPWSINTFIKEDRMYIINEWLRCKRNNIQLIKLETMYTELFNN